MKLYLNITFNSMSSLVYASRTNAERCLSASTLSSMVVASKASCKEVSRPSASASSDPYTYVRFI